MAKISIEEQEDLTEIELSVHNDIRDESSSPSVPELEDESKHDKNDVAPNNKGFLGKVRRLYYYFLLYWFYGPVKSAQQILSRHKKISVIPKRKGDIAVVTGGARGIGLEVTKKLLQADMHVIIGCRDVNYGKKAILSLRTDCKVTTGSVECIALDLQSFDSVRNFAKIILDRKLAVDILINNAGIMLAPYKLTVDGLESQLQVNYLSHFLLTYLLLPALIKGGRTGRNSRVVNVSSFVQQLVTINFEDFLMKKFYSPSEAYCSSKLLQVASTKYLDDQFQKEHVPVRCHAVHPGIVGTELHQNSNFYFLLKWVIRLVSQNADKGADPVVYVALSEELEDKGGTFTGNCKPLYVNPQALDKTVQERLWNLSCDLTHLDKLKIKKGLNFLQSDSNLLTQVEII